MKNFIYKGKHTNAVSLTDTGDVILIPAEKYELNEKNSHVQTLIATGQLEEVTEPEADEPVRSRKSQTNKKS